MGFSARASKDPLARFYSSSINRTANVLRYFPTQALNFAFKDTIKAVFNTPKNAGYVEKFGKNILSGGVAGSMSLTFVYSLDYARTRLANDRKSKEGGERKFNGL